MYLQMEASGTCDERHWLSDENVEPEGTWISSELHSLVRQVIVPVDETHRT